MINPSQPKKYFSSIFATFTLLFTASPLVHAASGDSTVPILPELETQLGDTLIDDLGCYVSNIASFLLLIAALALFLYLVWGGLSWITAGPDKNKVEEARSRLTNALIGLTIVASSWAIFLLATTFFGISFSKGTCGNPSSPKTVVQKELSPPKQIDNKVQKELPSPD